MTINTALELAPARIQGISYNLNTIIKRNSKTALKMPFLQKRVVAEGGVRSELSEDNTEKYRKR